jgi:hypothetical protein
MHATSHTEATTLKQSENPKQSVYAGTENLGKYGSYRIEHLKDVFILGNQW